MDDFAAIIRIPTYAERATDGVWDLTVTCPFCGDVHHHGGGSAAEPVFGPCLSHCFEGALVGDYVLVAGPAEMVKPKRVARAPRWPR